VGFDAILLRGLTRDQRIKAVLLSLWFFLAVATLWLLKPVRTAELLANLGATETPYVRLASVVALALAVLIYSVVINRLSRVGLVRWSNVVFAVALFMLWLALRIWGTELGTQRPFVWLVYALVEIYSVMMVGIFWTYTNDVVTTADAERLYGVIGLGGVLGGIAGGAFVDSLTAAIGTIDLLLISAVLLVLAAVLASVCEAVLRPPARPERPRGEDGFSTALQGAIAVRKSRYLSLLVTIVVTYEFAATLTDFAINVIFEHNYVGETELAKMYGRLGWIVGATAMICQIFVVPVLLPRKAIALLVAPIAMTVGACGALAMPVVATAIVLAASDRGINYSVQQATKESLYVPLDDEQKYKAKAFIDMFVDRVAKSLAAFVLIAIIAIGGDTARVAVAIALVSIVVWLITAHRLGRHVRREAAKAPAGGDVSAFALPHEPEHQIGRG
jgi:AAA family ATP:ADP antiporter